MHLPPAGTHTCQANLVAAWSVWDEAMVVPQARAFPFFPGVNNTNTRALQGLHRRGAAVQLLISAAHRRGWLFPFPASASLASSSESLGRNEEAVVEMLAAFGLAPSALIVEGLHSLIRPQCVRSGVALSAEAGARKVLWEPKPEVMEQTAMRRFQHVVRGGRGVEGSYEELWKWSVENSDAFWTTLLDFVEIEYSGSTTPAKEGTLMPDVTYFPNVEVNFAENMLKHGAPGAPLADAEAVVSISEARDDVRWTFSELRDDSARVQAALCLLWPLPHQARRAC